MNLGLREGWLYVICPTTLRLRALSSLESCRCPANVESQYYAPPSRQRVVVKINFPELWEGTDRPATAEDRHMLQQGERPSGIKRARGVP